jgi:hypothetical protein
MAQTIINHFIRIVFLILLQSLVVSKVQLLDGLILPWIYIFGLLMLPFETPRWLVLVVAFFVGLIMDYFTGPMGLHSSACVFMGYAQPVVQRFLAPREGYEITQKPTIQRMGIGWYVTYAGMLTLAHHSVLFFLEVFRLTDIFYLFLHILLSSVGTLALMVIGQFLIFNVKRTQS